MCRVFNPSGNSGTLKKDATAVICLDDPAVCSPEFVPGVAF